MTTNVTSQPDTDRSTTSATTGRWVADGKKTGSRLRGTGRRRSIPHLLLGALLVLACAAAFLVVSLNSDNRVPVLALARPVSVGHVLTTQDLRQASVIVDPEVSVVDARRAGSVVGRTISTSLPAGALLTPDTIGGGNMPTAGQAIAALSLKAGQFPPEVSPGTHVSVVFAPGPAGGTVASPPTPDSTTSWPAVVTNVTSPPNEQTTVVSMQFTEAAARQVAAVPAGQLSIVMLSGGSR
ncbi:SAF domain-containing protein [Amycolatopsis sp. H20-H5]|uniref:SAF domain-containing protein n=1 Tax=Amycolatopsis sp. H20-H5 TaxID=3046309 RepID=UPI002DB91C87|nr:SAF domain-containing protein [Amycolatopsis sp. H20-H5]MEC3978894.1 SAF domain-containing protein [Amycolatopsis sp. H20-H5]